MSKQQRVDRQFSELTDQAGLPSGALLVSVNFVALLAQCDNDDRKAIGIVGDLKALLR